MIKVINSLVVWKELFLTLVFILLSSSIALNRQYLIAVSLYVIGLWFISKNLGRALWISYVTNFLFFKAAYFFEKINYQVNFLDLGNSEVYSSWFVNYSDMLIIFLIYWVWRNKKKLNLSGPAILVNRKVEILMLAILGLGFLATSFSPMPGVSMFGLIQLLKFFVVFNLARALLRPLKLSSITLGILAIFVLVNSVLIVVQKIKGGPLGIAIESENRFVPYGIFSDENIGLYRPGGMTTSPNLTASILGMFIPILFIIGATKNRYNNVITWTMLLISTAALVFTASRYVWIVTAITIYFSFRYLKKAGIMYLPDLVARYMKPLMICFFILLGPFIFNRIITFGKVFEKQGGGIYRWHQIVMEGDFMKTNLFGIGLDVYQYQIPNRFDPEFFFSDASPPHNLFAEIGAGFGIFGIPLFVSLFYEITKEKFAGLRRRYHPLVHGVGALMISYILISMAHPWMFARPIAELFWVFAGYVYNNEKIITV